MRSDRGRSVEPPRARGRSIGERPIGLSMADALMLNDRRDAEASTEVGKKAGLFAKLQPGRARKRINAT